MAMFYGAVSQGNAPYAPTKSQNKIFPMNLWVFSALKGHPDLAQGNAPYAPTKSPNKIFPMNLWVFSALKGQPDLAQGNALRYVPPKK